jgi:sugar phosphate isomerase/epimerase
MGEDYFSRPNYFGSSGSDYFGDLDDFADHPGYMASAPASDEEQAEVEEGLNFSAKSIGANTDPFSNTLESLKARIREGTGRVEFNFLQSGKGNAQGPTPEMFGSKERRDMRELVRANNMKSSVHAPVNDDSLAGFDPQSGGFREEKRGQVQREIKRAIDFASEAGTGGAVVFHMHEWQRPVEELNERDDEANWREYPGPVSDEQRQEMDDQEKGVKYVVDERNGQPISESAIRKDQTVQRPKYETAATSEDVKVGDEVEVEGRPGQTHTLQEDDWVSLDGKYIPQNAETDTLFKRVPQFGDDQEVKTEELGWNEIKRRAEEYNERYDDDMEPEEYYAQVELENAAMQARGQSLRASRRYQQNKRRYKQLKKTLEKYEELKEDLSDDESFKADQFLQQNLDQDVPAENPEQFVQDQLKSLENELKYAHDASSSADAQAKEIKNKIESLTTVEDYGRDKTADTIANAADYAMQMYEKRKDMYDLEDPIYVAPENWNHQFYGSHPDEYKEIIENARDEFENRLEQRGMSEDEAKDKAQTHIQGTLDIGHMNTFRDRFERKEGEEIEDYEERFNEWLLDETKELVEDGYVGHIHLNDNFGYEDEHVTPGEGNAPMMEFLKNLEEEGMDDIIVEQGSFNDEAHLETLSKANTPVYGSQRRQRFNKTRRGHWGYRSPAMFMAGSYAPSNDFTLWSETPLE